MENYLTKFSTHTNYQQNSQNLARPNVSYCEDNKEVHYNPYVHDYSQDYFTTVALENGTISFDILKSIGTDMITSISYSTDNGKTWTTTNNVDDKSENLVINVSVSEGDKLLWKGVAQQLTYYDNDDEDFYNSFFSSDCEFDVMGNVMSLLYGDNFVGETTITKEGCFFGLFYDYYDGEKECLVVNANNLKLPATTLVGNCYRDMFQGCINLTTAPELLATTLADGCYRSMFSGCTSLTSAPQLPATTLTSSCYESMFKGCTNLTTPPQLPATTLVDYCYYYMFYDCTGLTSAPELPATTLASSCYDYIFYNCTSLNYIKAMFTTTPSILYTRNWVNGVAASGTFVKNSAAQWDVSGVDGIPNGWTIQTASE